MNIEHSTLNAEHRMKTLTVCARALVTTEHPNTLTLEVLIKNGAPVKWKDTKPLLRDATDQDVEFVGTVFRSTAANGDTEYRWNQT